MPDTPVARLQRQVEELATRAARSQAEARRTLNPQFVRDGRQRAPRPFVESSFLFLRSCDADLGSRPMACPVFWLSPDLRVAALDDPGVPARELTAGVTYRFTATLRNRGDLAVPSASVEFFLANPTFGLDTRFATRLGVVTCRVQAHAAGEAWLDATIPAAESGHRCVFARAFAFAPLDLPLDDHALNPLVDRHVAQRNLVVVAQGAQLTVEWVHLPDAAEFLELVPMPASMAGAAGLPAKTAMPVAAAALQAALRGRLRLGVERVDGPAVATRRADGAIDLVSRAPGAVPIERQIALTDSVLRSLRALEVRRRESSPLAAPVPPAALSPAVLREFRAMNAQAVRTRLTLKLPELGLRPGGTFAANLVTRSTRTGAPTGGVALLVVHGR